MIKKFVTISNVGIFDECSAGSVQLDRFNVIYAPNGYGKTTLCSILRSVGDLPSDLEGRRRLASTDPPYVELVTASGMHTYEDGNWGSGISNLSVFDEQFIYNNVHSGYYVDHDHKKGLYHVAVGETGTGLAQRIAEIDDEVKDINSRLRDLRARIQTHIRGQMSLDDFIELPEVEDIGSQIEETEEKLTQAKRADEITEKATPTQVDLPEPPKKLEEWLKKGLDEVVESAVSRVRSHINEHLDDRGERWVRQGLDYVQNERCPFCRQNLKGVELVDAYKEYFSEAYSDHVDGIARKAEAFLERYDDRIRARIESTIERNGQLVEEWGGILGRAVAVPECEDAATAMEALYEELEILLVEKRNNPLSEVDLSDDYMEAVSKYRGCVRTVEAYDKVIKELNKEISQKKKELAEVEPSKIERQLTRLRNCRRRHSDEVSDVVAEYVEASEEKKELTEEKEEKKEELDTYTDDVFDRYRTRINHHLQRFGADFGITKLTGSYRGGKPNSDYALSIRDVTVPLGDEDTTGNPSFRTTLSGGDKSALAFAFYLARRDMDESPGETTVVIDDPVSSLDSFRRDYTTRQVCSVASDARQTLVLSHRMDFLADVYEGLSDRYEGQLSKIRALKLVREGGGTCIRDWDIEAEAEAGFVRDYRCLQGYLSGEGSHSLREVVRAIRPVLETNLYARFPNTVSPNDSLGEIIHKIDNCSPTDPIADVEDDSEDLKEVNDYTINYTHGGNTQERRIDPRELRTKVERCMMLLN